MGVTTVVIGGLNTDILAVGAPQIVGKGELAYGGTLAIAPGGKSRNIAQMVAALTTKGTTVMIGKTARDAFGLWRVPMDALRDAGVNTNHVTVLPADAGMPGIALIPVDTEGNNQIYVVPGVNETFSPADIDSAFSVFEQAAADNGCLITTLECPYPTVLHATKRASAIGLRVLLDPGGMRTDANYEELLAAGIFFLKPNIHEARMLTGIDVVGLNSAAQAAAALRERGIQYVLITAGRNGGYLFGDNIALHLPVPHVEIGTVRDETGCGDQTMAAFAAWLHSSEDVLQAAKIAILAGTLQYGRLGVQPVRTEELEHALRHNKKREKSACAENKNA